MKLVLYLAIFFIIAFVRLKGKNGNGKKNSFIALASQAGNSLERGLGFNSKKTSDLWTAVCWFLSGGIITFLVLNLAFSFVLYPMVLALLGVSAVVLPKFFRGDANKKSLRTKAYAWGIFAAVPAVVLSYILLICRSRFTLEIILYAAAMISLISLFAYGMYMQNLLNNTAATAYCWGTITNYHVTKYYGVEIHSYDYEYTVNGESFVGVQTENYMQHKKRTTQIQIPSNVRVCYVTENPARSKLEGFPEANRTVALIAMPVAIIALGYLCYLRTDIAECIQAFPEASRLFLEELKEML